MRSRKSFWILLCLLGLAGAWFFWHQDNRRAAEKKNFTNLPVQTVRSASTAPKFLTVVSTNSTKSLATAAKTNKFAYRLSNTSKSIGGLVHDDKAILLENALIDLRIPLNFSIPKNLQAQGDPGAYIVQANGPIDNAFRAMLATAGATIVSYIPNDAYLVRASSSIANGIAADGFSVIPYEPYYKVQSSLLAFDEKSLPDGTALNLGLFADNAQPTIQQIEKLGGQVFAEDSSPFGKIVRVIPPQNWTALAQLPGVQIVEPFRKRALANDLSRATIGVSINSTNAAYYTNVVALTGKNVMVEVNDSGIDDTHPDFTTGGNRVFGAPADLTDTSGHGTHVAGIIAGNGTESTTVTNAQGSINPGVAGQYRGMAPMADLFIQDLTNSDSVLQETPALTNALISNNSWVYDGNSSYDLAAASYDAATRDALPFVTGSQPVLFVFAAGNDANGDDTTDPGGGVADSIQSPATAKDVITVGALQEFRNITNVVTNADGTISTPWQAETSTSYRVAGSSSRGNVGIGIEGTYGRFKPDVVAPGTFIVSTRSSQWDVGTYFYQSPTNDDVQDFSVVVQSDSLGAGEFPLLPANTVGATIQIESNPDSPVPFPDLPIYVGLVGSPAYPYSTANNQFFIPPQPPGVAVIIGSESTYGFNYAISNVTSEPINFDIVLDTITTNNPGNYQLVYSNLDDSLCTPPYYYRYESGTSMAAPAVSGVLALLQQFFTNQWDTRPSPALLKAMLINGARATGFYDFQGQNTINYEGWGLINLPDSLPPGITTNVSTPNVSMFIQDQSPNNALATGDSRTFTVTLNPNALAQPLRVTLGWTDPPGDPVAATKLVNDLNLVVTDLDNPATPIIYYGNDIPASSTFNSARSAGTPPNYDSINNVENVYLPAGAGTNFSVTVMGYRVNVNAVTAHTNNVVQDYALVISSGDGAVTNALTVTANPIVSNPTDQTTDVQTNNTGELLNQTVGANTPLLGNNVLLFNNTTAPKENLGTNYWQVTIGMTNQWHFYVVTNNGANGNFTNAAFITFEPDTLSIPRMGVFADSQANATQPEADIDLYVSTNPALTNLDTNVISAAITNGTVSLGRGGTEFVAYSNSTPDEIYYVGVKSETQEASEYDFLSVFTTNAFSVMQNGVETVNGLLVPMQIPDGSPALPGIAYIVALSLYPIEVGSVVVSNEITHQNFGDLIGTLNLGDVSDVLNNHDSLGNPPGPYSFIYDDSGANDYPGSQLSDGPGSLNNFIGMQGVGPWILTEVDDSLTQTGFVNNVQLTIQPHQTTGESNTNTIAPSGSYLDYVDVPPGATSLTITVTNLTGTASPPLELFIKYGSPPTMTNFDEMTLITQPDEIGIGLHGSISIGSPLTSGIYYYAVFNPGTTRQKAIINVSVGLGAAPAQIVFSSSGPVPLPDDAVTTNSIYVTQDKTISSVDVALRVDHPRVSDLVFHLISPDGTRDLLVENRGGMTTNGMGVTLATTNITPVTFSFIQETPTNVPSTNVISTGQTNGTLSISYNFDNIQPDELVVYYQGSKIFDSGVVLGSGVFNVAYGPGTNTQATIVMNPTVNPGFGDAWTYTVSALQTNEYKYLVLTEDTNKTTPIKFAPPPFGSTNSDLFYLPEQSLDTYAGKDANGQWILEVQDDRAGATSFAPTLVSWQLRFNFTTTTSSIGTLTNGVPQTNAIPANSIAYYLVNVPTNADFATNLLFTTSGPLNFWFNETNLPSGTNSPGDTLLFSTSVNDSNVLSTLSTPNIVPGGSYYLAVQNTNSFAIANYAVEVNFQLLTGTNLISGQPQTNTVAPGSFAFYAVSVPTNADIATNTLLFASGPVNLLFNQTTLPTGLGAGDFTLLPASTGGSTNLTVAGSPPLIPGTTYYLGVQNTSGIPVNFGIGVNFHLLVPIIPPIIISSITHTNFGFWIKWWAPTNDIFQVQWTGNLAPPAAWNTFSNIITYTGPLTPTNGLFTFFDDGSQFPFGPLRFYRLILLGSGLTNGVEQTNSIPPDSIVYYSISVPTNADFSTNSLFMTNGPLSLLFNQTVPPTGTNSGDHVLFSASANDSAILSTISTPTNIVPGGTYYLGVQNTNSFAVNYGIEVDFHLVPPPPPAPITNYPVSGVVFTNNGGTNGILLTWYAPTNYQFLIQWARSLSPSPISWATVPSATPTLVPGSVTNGTTGTYQWFDDFSLTGGFGAVKFYRLVAYPPGVTVPPLLVIGSVQAFPGGGVQLDWTGSTNYPYDVLWTTNLALATTNWNVLSNLTSPTLTYAGGVFTFSTNTVTLTGGAASVFFLILELP